MISPEMNRAISPSVVRLLICLLVVWLGGWACRSVDPPGESGLLEIRVGSFTFASLASVMAHVIKEKGLDRKHEAFYGPQSQEHAP